MDYNAIAKQYGAVQSAAPANPTVDYSALAKKFGATNSTQPTTSDVKGGIVGDLLTGNTQRFGTTIGQALAAPGNADLYAQSLKSHTDVQSDLLKAIQTKTKLGQDTSKLKAALDQHTQTAPQLKDFTGDVIDKTSGQVIGEGIGTGLEALSGGVLGSGAETVASKALSTGEKIKDAAKIGASYGAIGGGSNAMQQGGNITDTVIGAGTGALSGAALGGGLGALGAGYSKLSKLANPATEDIIAKREQEISNIENNYAKTRKVNQFSQDAGSASRNRVASTDVLVNAVDHDGLIRTKQPGGAVDQYKAMTLDNAENVVRNGLEKEGSKVSLNDVQKELTKQVYDSGLEGKNLTNALNDVKNEISGYKLKADADGNVPLTLIHDAKVDNYKSINYQTPPEVGTARKAVARGLRKLVEKNSSLNIEEVNNELGKYLKDVQLLENLDGKRVKGGRLGKYFASISGNIVGGITGHAVGGPVGSALGSVIGGELGARVQGNILSKMLGGETGNIATKSPILEKAIADNAAPRLALPAPTSEYRSQISSGPTINLPSRTATSIDEAQLKNLGNRNISQAPTNTTISNPIATSKAQLAKEASTYEAYTPHEQLPTIEMGKTPKGKYQTPVKGLPTIKGSVSLPALASGAAITGLGAASQNLTSKPQKLYEATNNPNVIAGIDISNYATDPQHENKVARIYASIPPTNDPSGLDSYIEEKFPSSPISGKMIFDAAKEYDISPRLLTAIMQQDSGLGTTGLGKKTKNPGNIANNDVGNKFTYPSWSEGVRGVARFLAKNKK